MQQQTDPCKIPSRSVDIWMNGERKKNYFWPIWAWPNDKLNSFIYSFTYLLTYLIAILLY